MTTERTNEMSKNIAQKALDEFYYKDKSLREWMQIIASEDCVSRAEVIKTLNNNRYSDTFCEEHGINTSINLNMSIIAINKLPPIQPKANVGYWEIYDVIQGGHKETWHRCSICKWENALLLPRNYCPKCGTKMEVKDVQHNKSI